MSIAGTALKVAQKQIPKFGRAVSFIRVTEGAYNPATAKTINTETTESVFALVEDVSGKYFSKDMIETEDKQVTVSADVAKLSMLDKITINGVTFTIANKGIKTIEVSGVDILYIYHGKKA